MQNLKTAVQCDPNFKNMYAYIFIIRKMEGTEIKGHFIK